MRVVFAPSSLLANDDQVVTRAGTVPFARERETRQTDRFTASDVRTAYLEPTSAASAAAKTLGLVSLPQPLDLAGQGRSYHIRSQASSPSAEDPAAPALRLAARAYRSSAQSTFLRRSFSTRQLLGRSATTCLPSWFLLHQRSGPDCMPGASSTAGGPAARVLLTSCSPPTPKILFITNAYHLPNNAQRGVIIPRATL